MLRSESIIMTREKVLEGKSAYAVSKELGFSKNTVKKYIDPKNMDKHGYPKGNVHKVSAFTMILGNSRTRFLRFTKRCDLFTLERCIIEAFEYFGGVPETLLTDNMKAV